MVVSHPLSAMFFIALRGRLRSRRISRVAGFRPALPRNKVQAGRRKKNICNQLAKCNSPSTGRSGGVAGKVFRLVIDRRQPGPETACPAAVTEDSATTAFEPASPGFHRTDVLPPPPDFRRKTPYPPRDSSHRTGSASLPPPHPRYTAAPRPFAASLTRPRRACGRPF